MARLADRIWDLKYVPPHVLCYRPEARGEPAGLPPAAIARLLADIAAAPAYAADDAAEFLFRVAARDRNLDVAAFPPLALPNPAAFVEFANPASRLAPGLDLPRRWGWHLIRRTPGQLAAASAGVPIAPRCAAGMVATLWCSFDDTALIGPLVAVAIQLDESRSPLGCASGLAFPHDPALVADPAGMVGYAHGLLMPALLALALLACRTTEARPVLPEARLNKARVRRGRPPLRPYRAVLAGSLQAALRFDGQAGIQGLAAALRACRPEFARDARPDPDLAAGDPDAPAPAGL